jgi:hypothetical protein
MIQEANILSLIGSGRYHSCIITTFSFDFYFFEMKVMKWLRASGVRNVNVLIDGHFYSEIMKQTTGDEMQLSPGYSLYPVFEQGIFHPKIWMLFGKNEGLLIVGSGNLTNSGNGVNQEIWGAFHFDFRASENSDVFSSAWNYLQLVTKGMKGIFKEKTSSWIYEHSNWLHELPVSKEIQFLKTSTKEEVAFLFNETEKSIFNKMIGLLGTEEITEITTVSPFYDTKGHSLMELKKHFPKAVVNVVLYEKGLIPFNLKDTGFNFYSWIDIVDDKKREKLHAKIIYFKTKGDQDYYLFGSANVTPEGLGIFKAGTRNSEASLLIKCGKNELVNKLGIKLSIDKKKELSAFPNTRIESLFKTVIDSNQNKIQLLSVELSYDTLTLYLEGDYNEDCLILLFDSENRQVRKQTIKRIEKEIELKVDIDEVKLRFAQIFDLTEKNALSNKIIISNYLLIAKTHPNPRTEEIEKIHSEIQNGELSRVLDLLPFAIMDEETDPNVSILLNRRSAQKTNEKNEESAKELVDLSSYKNLPDGKHLEKSILLSSSLKVLDILRFAYAKTNAANETDIQVDEQLDDISNLSGNEESEVKIIELPSISILKYERKRLLNYFDSLYDYFHEILYGEAKRKDYNPTLTDLTKYLIALELMIEYGGRSAKYDENNQQLVFNYLPHSADYIFNNDNVKGCGLNIIGDFLMLSKNGLKNYEFEYTRKKIDLLKSDAAISTIICLLNTSWRENELHYLNTLLFNTLHCLITKDLLYFKTYLPSLIEGVKNKSLLLKHRSNRFDVNLDHFVNVICPAYQNAALKRDNKEFDTDANPGNIIYSSFVGYAYVQSSRSVSSFSEFKLMRPGFAWNEKAEDYLMDSVVRIPKFILVNL